MSDDEAAVVVHEHADVEPLLPPVQEREDVRLPELIRRRALEPPRRVPAFPGGRRALDHPLLVQDPTHRLLRDAERLEALQHVSNPSGPPALILLLECDDSRSCRLRPSRLLSLSTASTQESVRSVLPELADPLRHRSLRYAECLRHVALRRPVQSLLHHPQLHLHRHLPSGSSFRSRSHAVSCSADSTSAGCRRRC